VIDTGSMVTTISESFYNSLENRPKLQPLSNFRLKLIASNGQTVPYTGYIEADVKVPNLSKKAFSLPILVVEDCISNTSEPAIIGINFIRMCKTEANIEKVEHVPAEWNNAFSTLVDNVGTVKTTQRIKLQANEVRTVTGFVRKVRAVDACVTEPCDEQHCSSRVNICPRIVTLDKPGSTARVPVRLFNLSAKPISIPAKANICDLREVKVLRDAFQDEETDDTAEVKQQKATSEDNSKPSEIDLENANLTTAQKEEVQSFLDRWQHIFSKDLTDLGKADIVEHEIHLSDDKPFKEAPRHIPPGLFNEVKEHLKEMLECGAIRHSNSPYSSNVVIVRKKDGTIRFCLDYRKLNQRTIKDAYSIPRIENTLHLLSGSKYFSKLDLRSGYWQVSVKEEDKQKTAFSVGPLGFYEANIMPFGLTNAPATFQRLMERCMGDLNLQECLIYLDDIIIFSETFNEHLKRLNSVFTRLEQHNLKLKASKCEFFKPEVIYLGHLVSENGIATDPEKTEAVRTWPIPKNTKDVRKFLGFTGYYRRFIKGYAQIVRPLNDLLIGHSTTRKKKSSKKEAPFVWEKEQQEAFDKVIEILVNPPVLAYANYQLPFRLHTDASGLGLGAVLYQRQGSSDRVVAYASRSLKPAEKNYPAHKLEFLALKWAVTEKFNDYLYGCKFEVWTDNNPLTYVKTTA